jgi:hypothetical protein
MTGFFLAMLVVVGSAGIGVYLDINNLAHPRTYWLIGYIAGGVSVMLMTFAVKAL